MNAAAEVRFRRIFWMIAGIHAALIAGLLFYSVVRRWWARRTPRETVTFVSLHNPAVAEPPAPAPPHPTPPEPVAPPPTPPPPRPQPQVQRSTKRVRRDAPRPPPPAPTLSPEEIRRRLEQAVPETRPASGGAVAPDAWARYYALLHETLYRAWTQPTSVMPGQTATARIRVLRDGTVVQREITRSSGHPAMDQSIMRAMENVQRLPPLPTDLTGAHRDFTIQFELTGGL